MYTMKRLVFDTAAIRRNIGIIRKKAGPSAIYGVLTGDGYGAGLTALAALLREEGIDRFAVQEPEDVQTLREHGFETEEILLLRSTADREELNQLLDLGAVCTVGCYETAVALNTLAAERAALARVHILIDTGMGFGGFLPTEGEKLLSIYQYLTNLEITGVYTHLCAARGDINPQLEQFSTAMDVIRGAGYDPGVCHAASSSALMAFGHTQLNAVRVGSAFLGLCHRGRGRRLEPCCWGEAALETVRWLPKGNTVGNERLYTLHQPTRVAVLPVGYLNGFGLQRSQPSGLRAMVEAWVNQHHRSVTVNGQKARIIGRISAVETAVDVSDVKCSPGDIARFEIDPALARGLERCYLEKTPEADP